LLRRREVTRRARTGRERLQQILEADGHGAYNFLLASGFASSRACSMKSCAVGLIVRFFTPA